MAVLFSLDYRDKDQEKMFGIIRDQELENVAARFRQVLATEILGKICVPNLGVVNLDKINAISVALARHESLQGSLLKERLTAEEFLTVKERLKKFLGSQHSEVVAVRSNLEKGLSSGSGLSLIGTTGDIFRIKNYIRLVNPSPEVMQQIFDEFRAHLFRVIQVLEQTWDAIDGCENLDQVLTRLEEIIKSQIHQ